MSIDDRLLQLEKYCRKLTFAVAGLLVISAGALLSALTPATEARAATIQAQRFVVTNASGREALSLSASRDGSGVLILRGNDGSSLARMEATPALGASLTLYDAEARPRCVMGTEAALGGRLILAAANGSVAARIGEVGNGNGSVDVYRSGQHGAFLCVDPELGSSNLSLFDDQGRLMLSAHADQSGNGKYFVTKR